MSESAAAVVPAAAGAVFQYDERTTGEVTCSCLD
jgi:hypothetical protein